MCCWSAYLPRNQTSIQILDLRTQRVRSLMRGTGPVWSVRNQIALLCPHRARGGGTLENVCITDPTGKRPRLLTRLGAEADISVSWSPDGRRLVYSRAVINAGGSPSDYPDIMSIAPRAGARPHVVVRSNGSVANQSPVWAPDGRSILFRRGQDALYTVRPDGSDMRLRIRAADIGEAWLTPVDWQPRPRPARRPAAPAA